MKNLLSALFIFSTLIAQASPEIHSTPIKSNIEHVTVFLTGGEVHRKATVPLRAGRNKLIFTEISTLADHKSIQFMSDLPLNLVSVSTAMDYLTVEDRNPEIKGKRDTLEMLKNEEALLRNELAAYEVEKQLLMENKSIKGENSNLTVEEISAMATYYRNQMIEIGKAVIDCKAKIDEKYKLIARYNNQLSELNFKETAHSNQIIVIVDAPEKSTANIDLKYIVSNCGWQANYDLLATNLNDNITLKYKAKVYNNTGNDWNNVNLKLSTADPNLSASAPELSPWYLSQYSLMNQVTDDYEGEGYVVPQNRAYKKYYQNSQAPQMSQNLSGLTFNRAKLSGQLGDANINFSDIQVSQLSTTFDINKPYSIPSDSKPYLVEITTHNLQASFSHKAVPKIDQDAFLLGNIVGWEQLDLVPGPTQVYFSQAFVGQSYINTANVQDTLRLSFGRDNKIPVVRKLVTEYSDKQVVGNNRKDAYLYTITVQNNRAIPVRLNLYDQIPISQDSDISVTIDEITDAKHDETTGKLEWVVNLTPGESKTYKVGFTIKYPKDKKIQVKQFRTISCPTF